MLYSVSITLRLSAFGKVPLLPGRVKAVMDRLGAESKPRRMMEPMLPTPYTELVTGVGCHDRYVVELTPMMAMFL